MVVLSQAHNYTSILAFPDEILCKIVKECDTSEDLMSLRWSCRRFYNLLSSPASFDFHPWKLIREIDIRSQYDIRFKQKGNDLLSFLYDHQVQIGESDGGLGSVKFMGARAMGDRCCYSRLPLNLQIGLLHQHSKAKRLSTYFEIFVKEGTHLRIGLVRRNSSPYHPPGSGLYGVGYQSNSGYICLSAQDGDKFQFGPPWKAGDIVGCGYVKDLTGTCIIYFTLNGHWIGEVPLDISGIQTDYTAEWHAAISSSTPASASVNVGQIPFKFEFQIGALPSFLETRIHSLGRKADENCGSIIEMIPRTIPAVADPYLPATVDGFQVSFPDNGFEIARSVFSSTPILFLPQKSSFYFEVTILEQGPGSNSFLSIGLSVVPLTPFHQIGWDRFSIGYHSDDGKVYQESHQNGRDYGVPFSTNAVVGCGYDAHQGEVYFTLNGMNLGNATTRFFGEFHAAISAIRGWIIQVNLGDEDFVYKRNS